MSVEKLRGQNNCIPLCVLDRCKTVIRRVDKGVTFLHLVLMNI